MVETKNTGDILDKLQKGFGPELADELTKQVANPVEGFIRQSLIEDFKNNQLSKQPAQKVEKIPVITNDGEKSPATLTKDAKNALDQAGLKATSKVAAAKTGFFGGKQGVEPKAQTLTAETPKSGLK